jgi:hypothetical protein
MKNTKLLVVVDESPATKRTLEYVAQVASRSKSPWRMPFRHRLPNWSSSEARRRPGSVRISADGFPWRR